MWDGQVWSVIYEHINISYTIWTILLLVSKNKEVIADGFAIIFDGN